MLVYQRVMWYIKETPIPSWHKCFLSVSLWTIYNEQGTIRRMLFFFLLFWVLPFWNYEHWVLIWTILWVCHMSFLLNPAAPGAQVLAFRVAGIVEEKGIGHQTLDSFGREWHELHDLMIVYFQPFSAHPKGVFSVGANGRTRKHWSHVWWVAQPETRGSQGTKTMVFHWASHAWFW